MNKKCILFVHGLGSNEKETWGALSEVLNKKKNSSEFDRIDFDYFNYDSSKLSTFTGLTRKVIRYFINTDESNTELSSQINKIASSLRTYLKTEKFSDYKSISIVAHSMGGVISAKYILNELDQKQLPKIDRILYICTPFVGSIYADIAKNIGMESRETGELTTSSSLISSLLSKIDDIERKVNSTYFFGDGDEIINECSDLFDYFSKLILKGDHSSILNGSNLNSNYEHIENFILDNECPTFLENLYYKAVNNNELVFEKKYLRKIESTDSETNLYRNHLDMILKEENPSDFEVYEKLLAFIDDNHYSPHEPYVAEKFYVENKSNEAALDDYWSKILSKDEIDPYFYIGPRGSGKTLTQNVWIKRHFKEMEENNIVHIRCDVHKIYKAMRDNQGPNGYTCLKIDDYLDMQFFYVFLKYRDKKYNRKGKYKLGAESSLFKSLYNQLDLTDKHIIKGSKFKNLEEFVDAQSNNIKHNEDNLRPGDRAYSYAIELMGNIKKSINIDKILVDINPLAIKKILDHKEFPIEIDRLLGPLEKYNRSDFKREIIDTIQKNSSNSEEILKSDLKTTLLKICEKVEKTKINTTLLWQKVSKHIQYFALVNNYKLLKIIDGIDNIIIQDSSNDKIFFRNKVDELIRIRKQVNEKNVFYFISLRDDSFIELEYKEKRYQSASVDPSDLGFFKYRHVGASDDINSIKEKRLNTLEQLYPNLKTGSLYSSILSFIFKKYDFNLFIRKNKFRNIREFLRHHMFLSLHTLYEFRRRDYVFSEELCSQELDKLFEETFFLRSRLYIYTEETTGDKPDYKYKVFPNIFYTHHRKNDWTGLCRLRILQLLKNNSLTQNEIIEKLGCLYQSKYIKTKIENLFNYNLIETESSEDLELIKYKSTYKAEYLLSIIKKNINIIYFLCLDTPLPTKYVNSDGSLPSNSYLSIFIRKIDHPKNTGYGNSMIKSISTFILYIKYIHEQENKRLVRNGIESDIVKRLEFPLNVRSIEKSLISVFNGTISKHDVVENYFMQVGKYRYSELKSDLSKYAWSKNK